MVLKPEMLDELLKGCKTPEDVDSLHSRLLQRMINRALDAEMESHLGYEHGDKSINGDRRSNTRNGTSAKTIKGKFGELEIGTPRDREGTFEPQLVKKRQIRLAGMEDKILTLYAKGLTTRDIEQAMQELYGVTISHTIISQVTDAIIEDVRAWQSRPLDAVYPIVWLDGIVITKSRCPEARCIRASR